MSELKATYLIPECPLPPIPRTTKELWEDLEKTVHTTICRSSLISVRLNDPALFAEIETIVENIYTLLEWIEYVGDKTIK